MHIYIHTYIYSLWCLVLGCTNIHILVVVFVYTYIHILVVVFVFVVFVFRLYVLVHTYSLWCLVLGGVYFGGRDLGSSYFKDSSLIFSDKKARDFIIIEPERKEKIQYI